MIALPSDRADLLDRPLIAHVGVVAPDGAPRTFPMWFVRDGDAFGFTTSRDRPQARWLAPGDAFAMSIVDPGNPYRYAGVGLRLVACEPDPAAAFFHRLADRYGLSVTLERPETRVVLRARPTRYWFQ
ncbi:MAG: PPOX class F420-dependent oxidoreductase [Thermoleophilia bacterium]|nr:PPOX class F420-dependent oxidoreductase [Thermoleophilia bacterium]